MYALDRLLREARVLELIRHITKDNPRRQRQPAEGKRSCLHVWWGHSCLLIWASLVIIMSCYLDKTDKIRQTITPFLHCCSAPQWYHSSACVLAPCRYGNSAWARTACTAWEPSASWARWPRSTPARSLRRPGPWPTQVRLQLWPQHHSSVHVAL